MRKFVIMMMALVGISVVSNFAYSGSYGCERKLEALERQLSYAKQYGNSHRISGLERAISNVKRYCGGGYSLDSSAAQDYYKADQELEILEKISDAKKDLAKAEYKLEKAKRKSDLEDVFEAEYKIKEAQGRVKLYEKYLRELSN